MNKKMNAPQTRITSFHEPDVSVAKTTVTHIVSGPPTPIAPEKLKQLRRGLFGRMDEESQIQKFAAQLTQALEETTSLLIESLEKQLNRKRTVTVRPWVITPDYVKAIEAGVKPEPAVSIALNHIHGFFSMGIGKRWHEAGVFENAETAYDTLLAWQRYFGLNQSQLGRISPFGRETFSRIENKKQPIGSTILSKMVNFYELMRRHPERDYVPGGEIMELWEAWNPAYTHDPKAFSQVLQNTMNLLNKVEKLSANALCQELYLNSEAFNRRKKLREGDSRNISFNESTVRYYAQAFELWMDRHHVSLEQLLENAGTHSFLQRPNGATPSGSSVPGSR